MGVTAQNWCAKCNLSFRMTSDLVFHMRSHHKKEFAAEAQGRRRREEKLTCPICHEYFRERHHLSRHMTSHNWTTENVLRSFGASSQENIIDL